MTINLSFISCLIFFKIKFNFVLLYVFSKLFFSIYLLVIYFFLIPFWTSFVYKKFCSCFNIVIIIIILVNKHQQHDHQPQAHHLSLENIFKCNKWQFMVSKIVFFHNIHCLCTPQWRPKWIKNQNKKKKK